MSKETRRRAKESKHIQAEIIGVITNSPKAMKIIDVFKTVHEQNPETELSVIREAIWRLTAREMIELTESRFLILK